MGVVFKGLDVEPKYLKDISLSESFFLFFFFFKVNQKVSFVACVVLRCTGTVKPCTQRSSAISLFTSKFKQLYLALIKVLTAKSKERANWGRPLDLLRMVFAFKVTAATRRLKGHFLPFWKALFYLGCIFFIPKEIPSSVTPPGSLRSVSISAITQRRQ